MIDKEESALIKAINKNRKSGKTSTAILQTDDRVLARITDGIYRQPASALRELISNSYDADATSVVIQTDAPRFSRIVVRDNGNGMDINSLARMIYHIGGSAKRTGDASRYGVGSRSDSSLSPKGRRLIGKIGIGLFSVSQLTRHFQIITKIKNEKYRLVADVILRTYSEQGHNKKGKSEKIQTGVVEIVSVPAEDVSSHGTEVILLDLRPQAINLLRSTEIWNLVNPKKVDASDVGPIREEPIFHIGVVKKEDDGVIETPARLPWDSTDKPEDKFKKLYQSIINKIGAIEQNPRLETTLDNYLRMLWTLSLTAPIDYIDKHPFDLTGEDDVAVYEFSNKTSGQAKLIKLSKKESLRKKLGLKAPERDNKMPFTVSIDDVQLFRPIRFKDLPMTSQAIKKPLLFVGKGNPNLKGISTKERGGDLSFEAYFMWAPKIVPKENNGLLIRISDASGTLFDETFAKYQISELTRLKQITAEIFVLKGLDAALNIDRESFNFSHPHYQYVMRWVHRALRQLTNTHKKLASDMRILAAKSERGTKIAVLDNLVIGEVTKIAGDSEAVPMEVEISDAESGKLLAERRKGKIVLDAKRILAPIINTNSTSRRLRSQRDLLTNQIKAVAQILEAYDLFDGLTFSQQEDLLRAIVSIFLVDKNN